MSEMQQEARDIFNAALDAVEPGSAVTRALSACPLTSDPFVIAVGKAASAMASAAQNAGASQGLIVTDMTNARPRAGFKVLVGDHPTPGNGSLAGGEAVEQAFQEHADVLVCLSGGSSAMVCAPAEGLTLHDLAHTSELLMRRGADIYELNTVRRHLSRIKGGQAIREGQQVRSLILSDVIGDDPAVIGSGLAAPDPTTFGDARRVLDRLGLLGAVTTGVRAYLELGEAGAYPDTPDARDPRLAQLSLEIVAGIDDAVEGARARAEAMGYRPLVLTTNLQGEAREQASWLDAQEIPEGRVALIAGGETTVTVEGRGRGGRSQEFALAFAKLRQEVAWRRPWTLLSAGTDGRDGPTDAAGGLIDAETVAALRDIDLALKHNDSHPTLDAASGLLRTGATGTNVGDIVLLLVGP